MGTDKDGTFYKLDDSSAAKPTSLKDAQSEYEIQNLYSNSTTADAQPRV